MIKKIPVWFIAAIALIINSHELIGEDFTIAKLRVRETAGISRSIEYVDLNLQYKTNYNYDNGLNIIAEDINDGEQVICQIIDKKVFQKESLTSLHIIFPISIAANEQKLFLLKNVDNRKSVSTDLEVNGDGLDLVIDNNYYRADLSKSNQSESKSHESGQLNELLIKMNFNKELFRTENRMHWAPNFQKLGQEYYSTIAGWENPRSYQLNKGPYLISTRRKDAAPDHPEIILTANYNFYAGLPYIRFFSSMDVIEDVTLLLLRNDEMTMDSMFTHVAYQNNTGKIIDLAFSERYKELDVNPIENNSPWLCFYNEENGYAFGSIRIKYDITNRSGLPSPTYIPHTKISDGAEGGKYWNRRLIHEYPIIVPKGSLYIEENAYIVFEISKENKFEKIVEWMNIITNPVEVTILYEN